MALDETSPKAPVRVEASQARNSRPRHSHKLFLAAGVAALLLATLAPGSVRAAWARLAGFITLNDQPAPEAPAPTNFALPPASLTGLTGQQQAELLMNAAINRDPHAAALVTDRAQNWRGRLKLTPELTGTLQTALNSHDLSSRAAALEVYLAVYNVPKTARSAAHLRTVAQHDAKGRGWALWMLGALGNRGVDPDAALATLIAHVHDSDQQTRYWTVEGLAHLGSDGTIAPLLDEFRNDPAQQVRERAACAIAETGMLSHERRLKAVPALIAMSADTSATEATRSWSFQALGAITGEQLGADSGAWRNWWQSRVR